jgi:hypothetical protein
MFDRFLTDSFLSALARYSGSYVSRAYLSASNSFFLEI